MGRATAKQIKFVRSFIGVDLLDDYDLDFDLASSLIELYLFTSKYRFDIMQYIDLHLTDVSKEEADEVVQHLYENRNISIFTDESIQLSPCIRVDGTGVMDGVFRYYQISHNSGGNIKHWNVGIYSHKLKRNITQMEYLYMNDIRSTGRFLYILEHSRKLVLQQNVSKWAKTK